MSISNRLIVTKDEISKSKAWISELVWWKRLVVLHFEVAMDWFGELNQWEWLSWEHVRLCDSDGVVLLVLLEASDEVIVCETMLFFK